jgi:hypothetical protein
MFSRWIVIHITPASRILLCHKIRIPFVDQLVICGLYIFIIITTCIYIHLMPVLVAARSKAYSGHKITASFVSR